MTMFELWNDDFLSVCLLPFPNLFIFSSAVACFFLHGIQNKYEFRCLFPQFFFVFIFANFFVPNKIFYVPIFVWSCVWLLLCTHQSLHFYGDLFNKRIAKRLHNKHTHRHIRRHAKKIFYVFNERGRCLCTAFKSIISVRIFLLFGHFVVYIFF